MPSPPGVRVVMLHASSSWVLLSPVLLVAPLLRSLLPRTSPLQGLPRFRGCKQSVQPSSALPYSPVLESSPPPTRCCLLPEITSFTGAGIWFAWFFTPFPGSVIVPGTYLIANKYLLSDPPPELSRGQALSAGGERRGAWDPRGPQGRSRQVSPMQNVSLPLLLPLGPQGRFRLAQPCG